MDPIQQHMINEHIARSSAGGSDSVPESPGATLPWNVIIVGLLVIPLVIVGLFLLGVISGGQ